MTKTKTQQAQEYADSIEFPFGIPGVMVDFISDVAKSAWLDGHTACEQSMWRSVEEELPEIPNDKKMIRVLAWVGDEPIVCWYTCHGRFITTLTAKERYSYDHAAKVKVHLSSEREDVTEMVTHWSPITPPSLPDTDTEKK